MNQSLNKAQLYRAQIAHFPDTTASLSEGLSVFRDGALVIAGERIVAVGDYHELKVQHVDAVEHDYRGHLIVPGLIDSHVHFPQTEMIACYGEQLLSWLENYTFPTEKKFAQSAYSDKIATLFVDQLLKNGTTTALAFSSVHKSACDSLFNAASHHNMAMIAGKVCMDRNCPDDLSDTALGAQQDSAELIEKWHGKGRNLYAITPRFAPTSSEAQMAALGELAQQYQDVFIQTHLSENKDEIEWVKALYPTHKGYLDVYDHYNMVRDRAVFGHCIHLTDDEWARLGESGATAAFCPTSNLFLGSGLFDNDQAKRYDVNVALASDVGAGTSFNLLRTYGEAYKISQLRGSPIDAIEGFYMMTQGAAAAHGLTGTIGNLNPGSHADFVILNPHFDALSRLRIRQEAQVDDVLFALSMLGDDRAVTATFVAGKQYTTIQENYNALA